MSEKVWPKKLVDASGPMRRDKLDGAAEGMGDYGEATCELHAQNIVPPDMMRLLWASVNRITRSGKVLGHAQRATVFEALKSMTSDAAYQYFEEDIKGTITAGKKADLVILSENPMTVDPMLLKDIKVETTIKDGAVVYQR